MYVDVWFSRYDGILYGAISRLDEEPYAVSMVEDVKTYLDYLRVTGRTPVQVGILPPDMLGLD